MTLRSLRVSGALARHALVVVVAVALPIVIAAPFGEVRRLVLPVALMIAVAVTLTLLDGPIAGLIATASSTLSLWFFNTPPIRSFGIDKFEDAVALLAAGLVQAGLVLLTTVVVARERSASRRASFAEVEIKQQLRAIAIMQRALLPETVPAVERVTVGWHYQTGSEERAAVGGDWLAIVPVGSDSLGLAVGDVAGHGMNAVRDMAQYRFALRTIAARETDPSRVIADVDEIARLFGIAHFSSCVYGVLDTTASTWQYTCAGHPRPLLIRAGSVEILEGPHGMPIAATTQPSTYRESTVRMEDGDLLALYSDGLIERRGERLEKGIERLGDALLSITTNDELNESTKRIVADICGESATDDVVLLIARYMIAARTGQHA